jgi:hypothetical protein
MYHPLVLFDGATGDLISGLLRPGRVHAAKGAATMLTRLIRKIRRRCPHAAIVVRGDSAFAMPKLMLRLEQLNGELGDIDYVFGLAKNPRLLKLAEPLRSAAQEQFADSSRFVRRFTWLPTPPRPGPPSDMSWPRWSTVAAGKIRDSS